MKAISVEVVATRILFLRGKKVMLDEHLAQLYEVETKALKRQVRRNMDRFPDDFMFRLTWEEYYGVLRNENGSLKRGRHSKYPPYVFTQEGVAMLSGILSSGCAVHVNIAIMRAFVALRELLLTHKELADKITALEKVVGGHDEKIALIFDAIKKLLEPAPTVITQPEKPPIGFRVQGANLAP